MNVFKTIGTFSLVAFAAFFAGCAVLTIDVDVYKGPLANDDKVQVEQLAAMAMGAKPLLVQLRDRLESKSKDPDALKVIRSRRGYQADFIPLDEIQEGGSPFFTEEHAKQVNAILSLYKSAFGNKLTIIFQAGREALNDYGKAFSVLKFSEGDEPIWNDLKGDFISRPDDVFGDEELKKLWASAQLEPLKAAYKQFFAQENKSILYRSNPGALGVFTEHCKLATTLKSYPALWRRFQTLPDIIIDDRSFPSESCQQIVDHLPGVPRNANLLFKMLQERKLIEFHSTLLFKPNTAGSRKFIERTLTLAGSFSYAREALARLWRLTMYFITVVNTPEFDEPRLQKQLLRVAAEMGSKLTEFCQLSLFLHYRKDSDDTAALKQLRKDINQLLPKPEQCKVPAASDGASSLRRIERIEEFRDVIIKAPETTVHALLQADSFWANNPLPVETWEKDKMSGEERRFGIVKGPTAAADTIGNIVPAELSNQFKQLTEGSAIGLEKGRLSSGLEELIESYLQEKNKQNVSSITVDREKERLLDGLVGFAQKILMLGNFNVLFEQAQRTEAQPYVPLLQAIGNAILTQVNELQTKKNYLDSAALRGDIEARALKAENEPSGQNTKPGEKGRLIDGLKGATELPSAITNDPRQVMDMVISKLQYEHVEALRRGSAGEAKDLEAAIEAASAHRADMVYVRPASFYLRNSFLFTGLQKDSTAVWKNMLSEHAWRQAWGPLRQDEAQIIKEFDKQYWQNVNTVRLAGGGKTNYVVAKDDVGNWYVKGFSSDPETIIQGAKSLALFAAKGAVSVGEVDKAQRLLKKTPKDKDEPATETKQAEPQPRLVEEQRNAALESHKSRTGRMLKDLVDETKGLVVKVTDGWTAKKISPDQNGLLKREVLDRTAMKTIDTSGAQPRENAVAAFKTVAENRDEVLSKMSKEKLKAAKEAEQKKEQEASIAASKEKAKIETEIAKLKKVSEDVKKKETAVAEMKAKVEREPTPENKDALATTERQYAVLKQEEIDAGPKLKEAEYNLKKVEVEISAHDAAVKKAGEDLEKIGKFVDEDIDNAKKVVRAVFADFLIKYVDLRGADLENYRTRLRAIRKDNAG